MEAMGGLRMHGSGLRAHDLSFARSSDSDRPSPKDEEVHMQAARANDAARAKAFATLSAAESRFTLIGRALRKACKAKAPAVLADFPSVALGEAAAAFSHQLSGLHILHASARVHTGKQQGVVTAFLGERFDEQGADLINNGIFTLELDPFQLAVGCYPVLQIALVGHLPLTVTVAPIVEAAKAERNNELGREV